MEQIEDSKLTTIRVVKYIHYKKDETGKPTGVAFPTYEAYFMEVSQDGKLSPITETIDGKIRNKSVRCNLSEAVRKRLADEKLSFPVDIVVDSARRMREGVEDYALIIDKDSLTHKARLDKNGNSHYILILKDFKSAKNSPQFTIEDFIGK